MRIPLLATILTGTLALTGCTKVVSLNGFVTEDDAVTDRALTGVWQDKDGDGIYVVHQVGKSYSIIATDRSSTVKLEARLMLAGDSRILDITAKDPAPCQLPVHVPARIWLSGDTLKMVFLDSDWLRKLAVEQLGALTADKRTVIGSPPVAVRLFIAKYGGDSRALGDEQLFVKVQ